MLKTYVLGVFMCGCLLGCSHSNKLETLPVEQLASLLNKAAVDVAKESGDSKYLDGSKYSKCMEHTLTGAVCNGLYKDMLLYLNKLPGLGMLKPQNIEDDAMYSRVKNDYQDCVFNYMGGV